MDAGGSQLIVSARIGQCASDRNELVADIAAIPAVLGRPETVLADNGYANGAEVAALEARGIEVLVSTAAEGRRRTHDFRPAKALPAAKEPKAEWLKAMGAMPLEEVGAREVAALHHRMRGMPSMANRAVWVLSRLFVLAETWEMVPAGRNPCRHARYYREKSRERFLTPEEFRRLGAALRNYESTSSTRASAVAALRLLMLTGCRTGEILSLRWDDVDRTAGVLRLRDGKTGPRMVPLTGPVQAVLDGIERVEGVPWVIRSKSDARLTGLFSHWKGIREEAGLDDVRVHDLRHSYASRALALGEGLTVIGRLLGHNKVETTAKYAHLVRDAEKAAAARTGDSIGAQLMPAGAKAA